MYIPYMWIIVCWFPAFNFWMIIRLNIVQSQSWGLKNGLSDGKWLVRGYFGVNPSETGSEWEAYEHILSD